MMSPLPPLRHADYFHIAADAFSMRRFSIFDSHYDAAAIATIATHVI